MLTEDFEHISAKTGEWNMSKLPVHHIVQAAYRPVSFNRCTLPDGPFGNCPTSFR